MSKRLLGVLALLAVACGGTDQALFNESNDVDPPGGAQAVAGAPSVAGAAEIVGGSSAATAVQPSGGAVAVAGMAAGGMASAGGAGPVNGAGSAGIAAAAGQGGSGGAAGSAAGGGASGTPGIAGSGGTNSTGGKPSSGGVGGSVDPIECPKGGLDCDGLAANGCETSTLDHDHCGACDVVCASIQKCVPGKATGSPVCLSQ